MITRPVPNWPMVMKEEVVQEILRLTRGHPYLVQLLCSELITWLNTTERRQQADPTEPTLADIAEAGRRALRHGAPYFTNVWAEVGQEGQTILAQIAETPRALPEEGTGREILMRLGRLDLIEKAEGKWQVQVPLIREWLLTQILV